MSDGQNGHLLESRWLQQFLTSIPSVEAGLPRKRDWWTQSPDLRRGALLPFPGHDLPAVGPLLRVHPDDISAPTECSCENPGSDCGPQNQEGLLKARQGATPVLGRQSQENPVSDKLGGGEGMEQESLSVFSPKPLVKVGKLDPTSDLLFCVA